MYSKNLTLFSEQVSEVVKEEHCFARKADTPVGFRGF